MNNSVIKKIKTIFSNILATTAISILLMCLLAHFQNYKLWGITISFEIFFLNVLIHFLFVWINKTEFKNKLINYLLFFIILIGVIISFGLLFHWFEEISVWSICITGIIVFLVAFFIDVVNIKHEVSEINHKLEQLRNKES